MPLISDGRSRSLVNTTLLVVLLFGAVAPLHGQSEVSVSEELRGMYEADQADRRHATPPTAEEWAAISERDEARRTRVHELLRADRLTTADDYYHAAMILQHGEGSEDVLLAHILATAAAFQGHERARWLTAAALDRYLHRTRQPQRFGTQYVRVTLDEPFRVTPDAPWSQGAYIRWLPDSLREVFGVDPLAEQAAFVGQLNGGPRGGPGRK